MADPFDSPPQIRPTINEDGTITLTAEEWSQLLLWLDKFKEYVEDNLP